MFAAVVAVLLAPVNLQHATVVSRASVDSVEGRVALLLTERLGERAGVPVQLSKEIPRDGQQTLVILMDVAGRAFLESHGLAPATGQDPGPEGFVLRSMAENGGVVLAVVAADSRGSLYAAGEILRRVEPRATGFSFPVDLNLRTAPAFRIRGTEVSQGDTMRQLTKARRWTRDEWRRAVLDYALAGANTFGGSGEEFAFLKSYGLMTHGLALPNNAQGPPEWAAIEPINRPNYVCLSIPAARRAVLEGLDRKMRNAPPYDIMRIASGDPGGCWCEKCEPWGKTYVLMCEEMAKVIHRYLPEARVYITNQEHSNAGDRFIFDYLNQAPRTWLAGIYYGPGSNAMSWNGTKRPDHRMDLFEYPGFGVFDGYLREILRELPRGHSIQLFTDATHWIASQYGLVVSDPMPDFEDRMPPALDSWVYRQRPDRALLAVYNRRTFFARPRAYYRIFQETARYTEGDITYSEGHHDHPNQWMWQRLLWAPHTSLEDLVTEYARTWFGGEAAPLMAQAILQLEQNLTLPLADNEGVERYYRLVKEAGTRMPEALMRSSHLWREFMEKACLDRYIQLRLRRQAALKRKIETAVERALPLMDEAPESEEMLRLRQEAGHMGEESERLFGVRNTGYFNLDQDLVGLGWIRKQLQAAAAAPAERKRELANLISHYDDPGEGSFYDDAGNPARSPHLIRGREYSVNNFIAGNVSNTNLLSQRTMAYTDDSPRGVSFHYKGLDPQARYRARFAFVRPRFLPRFARLHPERKQSIYADGYLLAADVEVPEWEAELFEYDIPRKLTEDGELTLWLEKSPEVAAGPPAMVKQWKRTAGWGTIVSDVWLLKR